FGHINPYKRVEAVLRAVKDLRASRPDVRYLLVGSISPSYDVRAAIGRAGLEDSVTVTGYVDRTAFEDYVAAADICLNLRHPTAGETSASALRLGRNAATARRAAVGADGRRTTDDERRTSSSVLNPQSSAFSRRCGAGRAGRHRGRSPAAR